MRILSKLYANLFGYFWLPCPSCGEMFGGHECQIGGKVKMVDGHAKCVCQKCNNDSRVVDEHEPIVWDLPKILRGKSDE